MNLGQLRDAFWRDADDRAEPHLFDVEDVDRWLNEAQAEAAIRRRLIRESADPSMCVIDVEAGTADYRLHPAMFEISYQAFRATGAAERADMKLVTREWLDRKVARWRDMEGSEPQYLVQDTRELRLVPMPTVAGELLLEGYRVPTKQLSGDADTPEIAEAHHLHLIQWALYRAYSVPDKEVFDPERATKAEAAFTRYFGARPDADLRNDTRMDEPQTNQAWW